MSTHRPEIYVLDTVWSRGVRGTRTDFISVYDTRTLNVIDEIVMPDEARAGVGDVRHVRLHRSRAPRAGIQLHAGRFGDRRRSHQAQGARRDRHSGLFAAVSDRRRAVSRRCAAAARCCRCAWARTARRSAAASRRSSTTSTRIRCSPTPRGSAARELFSEHAGAHPADRHERLMSRRYCRPGRCCRPRKRRATGGRAAGRRSPPTSAARCTC
jgi:hypothetical protein